MDDLKIKQEHQFLKIEIDTLNKKLESITNSIISACRSVKDKNGRMPVNAYEMAQMILKLRKENKRLVDKLNNKK